MEHQIKYIIENIGWIEFVGVLMSLLIIAVSLIICKALGEVLEGIKDIKSKLEKGAGKNIAPIILLLLLCSGVTVHAANPADLTADYRTYPFYYSKVAYDGGPWFALQIVPVGKYASLTLSRWADDTNGLVQNEAILSCSATPKLDIALSVEKWQGGSDATDVVFDLHQGKLGLGVHLPLLGDDTVKFGPRIGFATHTAYTTLPLNGGPRLYGLTHQKNDLEIDVAYGNGTSFLRASYWKRNLVPELRLKFTHEETFIGFALVYYPH